MFYTKSFGCHLHKHVVHMHIYPHSIQSHLFIHSESHTSVTSLACRWSTHSWCMLYVCTYILICCMCVLILNCISVPGKWIWAVCGGGRRGRKGSGPWEEKQRKSDEWQRNEERHPMQFYAISSYYHIFTSKYQTEGWIRTLVEDHARSHTVSDISFGMLLAATTTI